MICIGCRSLTEIEGEFVYVNNPAASEMLSRQVDNGYIIVERIPSPSTDSQFNCYKGIP